MRQVVVDEDFVIRIPDAIDLAKAAPLLCAGTFPQPYQTTRTASTIASRTQNISALSNGT